MSAAVTVAKKSLGQNTPTRSIAALDADASPVSTLESLVAFVASMDVAPAETEPTTWPPTPSPDVADDAWSTVSRLLPSWRSQGDAMLVMSAVKMSVLGHERPVNDAEVLAAFVSPVVTSVVFDEFASTRLADPPAEVTAPATWPATPSPLFEVARCPTRPLLLPC